MKQDTAQTVGAMFITVLGTILVVSGFVFLFLQLGWDGLVYLGIMGSGSLLLRLAKWMQPY